MKHNKDKILNIIFKTVPAIFFTLFLMFCYVIFSGSSIVVQAETTHYGRVVSSNVKLYRNPINDETPTNVYFILPQTYFVTLEQCDEDNFYCATYLDIEGYVKKSEIQCVAGTPQTAFANNLFFRMFIPGGTDLRSSPSQISSSIASVNYLDTNLQYYGKIDGEETINNRGTEWIYCKYKKNDTYYWGYLYSPFCDTFPTITSNTEILQYIDEPEFETVNTSAPTTEEPSVDSINSLPSATQIVIIVAVCLPCIFIIYLLFKPTRITARVMSDELEKGSRKSPRRRHKHRDYYEYEE